MREPSSASRRASPLGEVRGRSSRGCRSSAHYGDGSGWRYAAAAIVTNCGESSCPVNHSRSGICSRAYCQCTVSCHGILRCVTPDYE